jgi:general secretion pathway protein M
MSALAGWWQGLQTRERWLLGIGGFAVLATVYFLLVLEPLAAREQRLAKALAAEHETQAWLAQQRPLVGQAPIAAARERLPDGASLLAAINGSAGESGVAAQLKRVTPAAERGANLSFEAVPYANFMRWLLALEAQYGASVERVRIEQSPQAGAVNVELSVVF